MRMSRENALETRLSGDGRHARCLPLTDASADNGAPEGTRALFVGASVGFRNPAGHREVNYDDVAEVAEAIQTARLLMGILNRIEATPYAVGSGLRLTRSRSPSLSSTGTTRLVRASVSFAHRSLKPATNASTMSA
jgi:hypothetical protein